MKGRDDALHEFSVILCVRTLCELRYINFYQNISFHFNTYYNDMNNTTHQRIIMIFPVDVDDNLSANNECFLDKELISRSRHVKKRRRRE